MLSELIQSLINGVFSYLFHPTLLRGVTTFANTSICHKFKRIEKLNCVPRLGSRNISLSKDKYTEWQQLDRLWTYQSDSFGAFAVCLEVVTSYQKCSQQKAGQKQGNQDQLGLLSPASNSILHTSLLRVNSKHLSLYFYSRDCIEFTLNHRWEVNNHYLVTSACCDSNLEEKNNSTHGICLHKLDVLYKLLFSELKLKKGTVWQRSA